MLTCWFWSVDQRGIIITDFRIGISVIDAVLWTFGCIEHDPIDYSKVLAVLSHNIHLFVSLFLAKSNPFVFCQLCV